MKQKNIIIIGILAVVSVSLVALHNRVILKTPGPVDSSSENITLSGTYVCLPYLDQTKATPQECVFGILADDGVYYMVNFGASASAMEEFQDRKRITAKGFVVLKETLNTDHWAPYNMKGIFTITERQ